MLPYLHIDNHYFYKQKGDFALEEEVRQQKYLKFCRKYKILSVSLGIFISVLIMFLLVLVAYTSDQGTIAKGVVIGIPVGQLPIEEAKERL